MDEKEIEAEVDDFEKRGLAGVAVRAVLYAAIIYVITYFFNSIYWLWYVLAVYIVLDIASYFLCKYFVHLLKKMD
jgi:hypothetical protein